MDIYTYIHLLIYAHGSALPFHPINYFSTYSPDKQKFSYCWDIHLLSQSSNLPLTSKFRMFLKTLTTSRKGKITPITFKCDSSPRIKANSSLICILFFFFLFCFALPPPPFFFLSLPFQLIVIYFKPDHEIKWHVQFCFSCLTWVVSLIYVFNLQFSGGGLRGRVCFISPLQQ